MYKNQYSHTLYSYLAIYSQFKVIYAAARRMIKETTYRTVETRAAVLSPNAHLP